MLYKLDLLVLENSVMSFGVNVSDLLFRNDKHE